MKTNPLSLLKSEFAKNSLTLVSSSFIGQAIALLIYPLITRLFSQSDLGLYATWLSIVDVLTILSTGKYEESVMLGKDKREAAATARLAMRVNTVFSLAAVAVVAVIFALGKADYTVFLIPPMVFFCGTTRVYQALFNYAKAFGQMAFSNIANSVAAAAAKLAAGFAHLTNGTLPAGSLVGQMVGNINYRIALHRLQLPKTTWAEAKEMASLRRNFPLFSMPKGFVNSFSYNLPFILLAYYFDNAYIGLFSLAMTCSFRPVSFFSGAFHSVLYKNFSVRYRENQPLIPKTNKFIALNALVFIPVFVLGGVFANNIIALLFGSQWTACTPYLLMVLPWIFISHLTSSLSFLPSIFSTQRTDMVLNIVLFVLRLAALIIGIVYADFALAIALFAIVSAAMSLITFGWYYSLAFRFDKSIK
jgi:O-antigen/teichoic acid export membrane protein